MGYRYEVCKNWVHVEYLDVVDAYDISSQLGQTDFLSALNRLKKVIFDFSTATGIALSENDVQQFTRLARLLGSAAEKVHVALVVMDQSRVEHAEAFRTAIGTDAWSVTVFLDTEAAENHLRQIEPCKSD